MVDGRTFYSGWHRLRSDLALVKRFVGFYVLVYGIYNHDV